MKKIITMFLFLLASNASVLSQPLGLKPDSIYTLAPEVDNFNHWYGGPDSGYAVYLGKDRLAGFEVELQIFFFKGRITKSRLILGPHGLDNDNCILKYKEVVKSLNEKYGHFLYQKVIRDPLIDDLIAVSACTPVRLELYAIETRWSFANMKIIANLIGDDYGFYVEIDYISEEKLTPDNLTKVL